MAHQAGVAAVLERARGDVAPAIAAVVLHEGRPWHASWHGEVQLEGEGTRALRRDDRFDVASLTKVMATATVAAQLAAEGTLALDAPVAARLPGFEAGGKERVTARHLLAHASGLPRWRPYFEAVAADAGAGALFAPPGTRPPPGALGHAAARGRALVRRAVLAEPLEAPPGARTLYCDPGFLALGHLLEALGGAALGALVAGRVLTPLGLGSTGFVDPTDPAGTARHATGATFVPTGWSAPRRATVRGEVNDDNAWAAGGVAGHAGLFATASDVAALGQTWLDALSGRSSIVPADAAAEFARRDGAVPGSERALGWDTPSAEGSTLGSRLGRGARGAIGHLGFTGCSLWLDLDAAVVCALLTNHVHPSGKSDPGRLRALRRAFHDAVAEGLGIG